MAVGEEVRVFFMGSRCCALSSLRRRCARFRGAPRLDSYKGEELTIYVPSIFR